MWWTKQHPLFLERGLAALTTRLLFVGTDGWLFGPCPISHDEGHRGFSQTAKAEVGFIGGLDDLGIASAIRFFPVGPLLVLLEIGS